MDFDYSTETITPEITNLLTVGGTGGFELPIGTTAQRPVTGLSNGALRYNTDLNNIEGYIAAGWTPIATGTTTLTLTGDVTGTGAGTIGTTLATVNTNVGTFASVTVNGKGLVTAASALSGDITTSGAVATLATVNSNVGQFSAVTVNGKGLVTAATNLSVTGDATGTASGASIALTLATVNASPQSNTFTKTTINAKGLTTATSAVTASDITTALTYTPVNKAGDTVTGNLTFNGVATVTGLPTPAAGTDAANKNYVDASVAGLSWKQSVRAATTVAGTLATSFSNGSAIDGITLVTGDRILIKNQTTQSENGIYIVTAGAPTRSLDADVGTELVGATVYVDQGSTQADTGWTQTTNAPITIGTTAIVWAQFSGSGSYTAGTGLTLTGNTFSITSPVAATLGGTGQTTYAIGDLLYASSTSALSRLADIATGNVLISGGVSTAPSWGKVGLTTHVTGILPIANGGTNLSALGTANQILGVNAGATGLEYKTVTPGTAISVTQGVGTITINNTGVTSVAGTANQITASAATGAVTLSLPASVTLGTSLTISGLTANSFLYSGTAGLLTSTTAPTNGQLLIGNTGAAPTAATLTAGTGMSITNGAGSITLNNTGVTSVGLALPSIFSVSGSPVTTTGTLTATFASQTANTVFAAPNGSAGTPAFRTLAYADLPIKLYVENPSTPTTPVASGTNSVAIGSGSSSTGNNAVAIGAGSSASAANTMAIANGNFATAGDAQQLRVIMRNSTTTATTTELFIDGATQRLVLPNNSAWTFNIQLVGRRTDATGGYAMYTFSGAIVRDATAASTLMPASSRTTVFKSDAAWNATIAADTTNGCLGISVTGQAAKTIRWVATVELTQVTN